MRLALPLGLLGLLAILALILIYILKPKYEDKKISSTYVWILSLRYQKRKVPLQWLKNSLLLIVQIILIALIAVMMAQPYVVLSSKSGEKIVILSASASMMAETDGKTRFDRAKSEIADLAEKTTADQDKFTVILAADNADYVIRRSNTVSFIKQKLTDAKCTFSQADISGAMKLAEDVLKENPNADVYLYTDCDYEKPGKVHVVNVAQNEWNAAVLDFSAKRVRGYYEFTADIASYGRASGMSANLTVIDADGITHDVPKYVECDADGTTKAVWDALYLNDYKKATVELAVDDSFSYDNTFEIYKKSTEKYKVLLKSTNPGFLYSAFYATGKCSVDIVGEPSSDEKDEKPAVTSGYDLYVYDGTYPETMPRDGAVWLIDPPRDLPTLWGITLGIKNNGEYRFSSANGSSDTFKTIMKDITPSRFGATEYSKVLQHVGYESIMLCNDDPVLLARTEGSQRTVVFALDIHMSTLPVELIDFPLLISNLCDFSIAPAVNETLYTIGDDVRINARVGAESVSLISASGNELNYSDYPVVYNVQQPGVYTVRQNFETGRTADDEFFVRISPRESVFSKTGTNLVNPVVMTIGTDNTVKNDTMDIFFWLAIALFVLVCVEWGLQYREQY